MARENIVVCSDEVEEALQSGKPVVALESTIISHGMPYPENVETARRVERQVRDGGAIPATIALIKGVPKAGLSDEDLEYLGKTGHNVIKCSRRDLPVVMAQKETGATTVAATMILSALAGIRVFATGGIGGVHRGGAQTMDVSADLTELARTPVAVVSAGAKAILDIGLTLEYLETQGVPMLGYQTEDFPAFYTRASGFAVQKRVESASEIASIMNAMQHLGYPGGLLIANPIPREYEMAYEPVQRAIQQAVAEATESGISGKDVTPFLLGRIGEITGGESLKSNIQLVLNNAALGAEVAVALSRPDLP